MNKEERKLKVQDYVQNYKEEAGVYVIRCKYNDCCYFGSSLHLKKIMNRHYFMLRCGNHKSIKMQQDWNEYGEKGLIFEIIATIPEEQEPNIYQLRKLDEWWFEIMQKEVPSLEHVQ